MSRLNRRQHRRAHQAVHPDQRAIQRWERAQAWSHTTGRKLPPQMRDRQATSTAVPMAEDQRKLSYLMGQMDGRDMTRYGPSQLTSAQLRRITHKRNHLAAVRRKRKAAKQ